VFPQLTAERVEHRRRAAQVEDRVAQGRDGRPCGVDLQAAVGLLANKRASEQRNVTGPGADERAVDEQILRAGAVEEQNAGSVLGRKGSQERRERGDAGPAGEQDCVPGRVDQKLAVGQLDPDAALTAYVIASRFRSPGELAIEKTRDSGQKPSGS